MVSEVWIDKTQLGMVRCGSFWQVRCIQVRWGMAGRTDYTTSGNNTVILSTAAAASDILEVLTVTNTNSTNTYTQSEINGYLADLS